LDESIGLANVSSISAIPDTQNTLYKVEAGGSSYLVSIPGTRQGDGAYVALPGYDPVQANRPVGESRQNMLDLGNMMSDTPDYKGDWTSPIGGAGYITPYTEGMALPEVTFNPDAYSDEGFLGGIAPYLAVLAPAIAGQFMPGLFGGSTTAASTLAEQSAAMLAEGFTAADIAASLAGLGNAGQITSILTAAGVPASTASALATQALQSGSQASGLGITNWGQLLPQEAGSSILNPNAPTWGSIGTSGTTIGNLGTGTFGTTIGPGGIFGTNIGALTGLSPEVINALASQGINLTGLPLPGTSTAFPNFTGTPSTPGTTPTTTGTTPTTPGSTSIPPVIPGGGSGSTNLLGSLLGSGSGSLGSWLGSGASLLSGLLNSKSSQDAAKDQADAIIEAARIAADAAKFRPVGVSTRFGSSKFTFDPVTGYLKTAGYDLAPDVALQREQLMGMAPGMLDQYSAAIGKTAPMGDAASRMMELGQGYLASTPQEQAAKFMAEQNALLDPGNMAEYANLQNTLRQQGRLGLSVGGESGLMATNPELAAYQNKLEMQKRQLAAQSTAAGQQYATYGAGLVGAGGQMLKDMYSTQTAAYAPYDTTMKGAQYLEGLGQNAMDLGISLGSTSTAANRAAGGLLASGMQNAANVTGQNAQQTGSMWGNLLGGIGNTLSNMSSPQQAFQYDSATGQYKLV
jgi:hypothetical protein